MTVSAPHYPVRVEAQLDPELSRWLWLVKWFLAIPHYIVLAFLWSAYVVLSAVAFFAILFTGRYPRSIFEFNVGVLRWTWRVSYYAYGALATDRYPPFTLDDVADYPAHVEIAYPERLSRGLVLVKWWLLAIPHYLIVGVLVGGLWFGHLAGGLISLLAIVGALILAFTATYPQAVFDLILGFNRWVLRVAAYVGLMTDEYPPFRLDQGGSEPGGTLAVATGTVGPVASAAPPLPGEAPARTAARRWGAGRVIALIVGCLLILPSLGVMAGGGALLWADLTQRDAAGYITTGTKTFTTATYAITSESIDLPDAPGWFSVGETLGDVRISASSAGTRALFVGIAATRDVDRYLAGVGHAVTRSVGSGVDRTISGTARPADPRAQTFWVASSTGAGDRTLVWNAQEGDWSIVVLNADQSPAVSLRASVGATAPHLQAIAIGLLVGGGVFVILAVALIVGAVASRLRVSPGSA